MMENNKLTGKIYEESQWRRCWIQTYNDGGWITGEVNYPTGLYYIVNSDSNGEIVVPESIIAQW